MTASENHPERRWIERLLGRLGRGVAAEIQALGEVGRGRERQGEAGRPPLQNSFPERAPVGNIFR